MIQPINALERINELEWDARIILIRASGEAENIIKALKNFDNGIQDRDIYWFLFINEAIQTNYIGEIEETFYSDTLKMYFNDRETNVVLLGKDGGIKSKMEYLDLQRIFNLIDSMPMRQMEMREGNQQ